MADRRLKKIPASRAPAPPDPARPANPRVPARANANDVRDCVQERYNLPVGDAGAGSRQKENDYIFSQLVENADDARRAPNVAEYPLMTVPPLKMIADRCRSQFYHVKFWGHSYLQNTSPSPPFPASIKPTQKYPQEIVNDIDQTVTTLQGYIKVGDENSYMRFDIMGRREFDFYGVNFTIGILAPENSYSLWRTDPSQWQSFDGLTDLSLVGAEVFPVIINSSQQNDELTLCLTVPAADPGTASLKIPSGARFVTVNVDRGVDVSATGLKASFSVYPDYDKTQVYNPYVGDVLLVAGGQTLVQRIPNANSMIFENDTGEDQYVCCTFSQEL
jgi:hypothetical protein